jgi:hypothetical protein
MGVFHGELFSMPAAPVRVTGDRFFFSQALATAKSYFLLIKHNDVLL